MLDIRTFQLSERGMLIRQWTEQKTHLPNIQLWEMDGLPVKVQTSGSAQIFSKGEWQEFDTWELLSEGKPHSYFTFNLKWPGLIGENEYLNSFNRNEGQKFQPKDAQTARSQFISLAKAKIQDLMTAGNSSEQQTVQLLSSFGERIAKIAEVVSSEEENLRTQGVELAENWSGKIANLRMYPELAKLYLQVELMLNHGVSTGRFMPLIDILRMLSADVRHKMTQRCFVATDTLKPPKRGELRRDWTNQLWSLCSKLAADHVQTFRDNELQAMAQSSEYLSVFQTEAWLEWEKLEKRIGRAILIEKIWAFFSYKL